MREKAKLAQRTFVLTVDVAEAHRQVHIARRDWDLLGCQVQPGDDVHLAITYGGRASTGIWNPGGEVVLGTGCSSALSPFVFFEVSSVATSYSSFSRRFAFRVSIKGLLGLFVTQVSTSFEEPAKIRAPPFLCITMQRFVA